MSNKPVGKRLFALLGLFTLGIVIFNVILFLVLGFKGHNATFWTSYGFTMGGLLLSLGLIFLNFKKDVTFKDWFFGYPILRWIWTYLGIQMTFSVIMMVLGSKHFEINLFNLVIIIQLILLFVFITVIVSSFFAKETASKDLPSKQKVQQMRVFKVEVDAVCGKAQDEGVKAALMKLAEKVRFSDPVSHDSLMSLEAEIKENIRNIDERLNIGDNEGAMELINDTNNKVDHRNSMMKALK